MKFGEAIYEWMNHYKKNSVKPATYDRLETTLNTMMKHQIADEEVENVSNDSVQLYLNELVDDGYALSTIRKQFHLITAYADHIDAGYLCRGVRLPSRAVVKKAEKEVMAYSVLEQRRLCYILDTLEKPAYAAAILMMETGMRVGEVLALEWCDIDWRRGSVRINKTMVRLGNKHTSYIQKEAKTYSSNRTIPLSRKAIKVLTELKQNDVYGYFVIHDEHGDPISYETMRWQIRNACKQAGVLYFGQHVFRHTFATNCYNRGCDVKILSKLMGHSDVSVTYNTYIHLYGDALEEMRKVVG